jgi:anthranilate phosphoribosyltransferase
MSNAFRELLRKVGSGPHTSKDLTRDESAIATRMMLRQEATPAQIGAFLISQRIKRPTGEELAGILDAYEELGPTLPTIDADARVIVLGCPYDGRDRTLPVTPITALILAAAGCPVLMHGGDRMPTKEGIPLIELWQQLGVDWSHLSLSDTHQILQDTGLGFVYLPTHFPLAQGLVPYREQIGKRPSLATAELIWCPYQGASHIIVGFVHPPTEVLFQTTLALRQRPHFTTVKGLEGSFDLPRERTGIIGLVREHADSLSRLHLHPHEYGVAGKNVPLLVEQDIAPQLMQVLQGEESELMRSAVWNGGFYLWCCDRAPSIEQGMAIAHEMLKSGVAKRTLDTLRHATALASFSSLS